MHMWIEEQTDNNRQATNNLGSNGFRVPQGSPDGLFSLLSSYPVYLNQPRFTNQATIQPPRTNISNNTAP